MFYLIVTDCKVPPSLVPPPPFALFVPSLTLSRPALSHRTPPPRPLHQEFPRNITMAYLYVS